MVLTGAVIGTLAAWLVHFGNPKNMGICVACFIRDIAGAIGLHQASVVQYIRPEIPGFILGAFIIALTNREFRPFGGSSPLTRFFLGTLVMVGALVFLGCPLRMILRLAGGDFNALLGIAGFTSGIAGGTYFLRQGFTLGRSYRQPTVNGYLLPLAAVGLITFLILQPSFIAFSEKGPGAAHAPLLIALSAGLLVGILAQRSRICLAGGLRDLILIRDPHLVIGFLSIFAFALVFNLALGNFGPAGFAGQPIAHNDGLWNFLGMALAGLGSVLLGGCPLRQTILAGEGNTDSAVTFLGMLTGAALAHNFGLAASPAGVPASGKIAVVVGLVVTIGIAFASISRVATTAKKGAMSVGA